MVCEEMGVPGLTKFVDENLHLLTDYKLHNTRVIIDGNNLYYFLYYYFRINHQFGGDYDHFAQATKYFFQTLISCNVSPFVVFDGGYDADDRKLNTTLHRMKERRHLAGFVSRGMRAKVLPILAYDVFKSALNDLGIGHVTCDFEADNEVAALANEWNCPVLSNDSDFFIFDLKAGFILIDYFNLKINKHVDEDNPSNSYSYLEVQIYYMDTFLKQFKGMERGIFPLFATLIGNDFVDSRKSFQTFFSKVKLPKPHSKRFSTRRNSHMISLLLWLESQQNVEDAVSSVMNYIDKDLRENIRKIINQSIASYTSLPCGLVKYIQEENDSDTKLRSSLKTYFGGHSMPPWFVRRVRQGELPGTMLNAINLHRVMLLCQVEDLQKATSYDCSLFLRQALYGVLLSLDRGLCSNYPKNDNTRKTNVEEYDRDKKNLKKQLVEPLFTLPNGEGTPLLSQICDMTVECRKEILLSVMNVSASVLENIAPEVHLLVCTILFWLNNVTPKASVQHVQALLVCFIKLREIDQYSAVGSKHYPFMGSLSEESIHTPRASLFSSSQQLCEAAHEKLWKFTAPPKQNNSWQMDMNMLHVFAQFQTCLRDAMYLNQVLLLPLPNLDPAVIFNGTFLYNFTRELNSRKFPDLYIQELLGRSCELAVAYQQLYSLIVNNLPADRFDQKDESQSKKSKKKRKKTSVYNSDSPAQNGSPSLKPASSKGSKVKVETACEITNRFGSLCLDEDSVDEDLTE